MSGNKNKTKQEKKTKAEQTQTVARERCLSWLEHGYCFLANLITPVGDGIEGDKSMMGISKGPEKSDLSKNPPPHSNPISR